ncbi:MAG: hypothetical protein R2744_13500 [Bacteroidales bacterium]
MSPDKPWRLTGCVRGAFGTAAGEHNRGDTISLLADHAYRVFLTDPELTVSGSRTSPAFLIAQA